LLVCFILPFTDVRNFSDRKAENFRRSVNVALFGINWEQKYYN